MKRKVIKTLVGVCGAIALCCVLFLVINNNLQTLSSSNSNSKPSTIDSGLITIDSINKKYEEMKKDYPELKIINTQQFKGEDGNYVLFEVQYSNDKDNFFELHSLTTGRQERLMVGGKSSLEKIVNENEIIFNCNGEFDNGSYRTFPYKARCFRVKNSDTDYNDENFISVNEDIYIDIKQSADCGSSLYANIKNIIITTDGVEILFDFDAIPGSINLPETKATYDHEKNQLVLEFKKCSLGGKYDKARQLTEKDNPFINSVILEKADSNSRIRINLNGTAKKYNIKNSILPSSTECFAKVSFSP
jgi:hypothetical protein